MSLGGLIDVIHWLEEVFDRLKSDARTLLSDESLRELEQLIAELCGTRQ